MRSLLAFAVGAIATVAVAVSVWSAAPETPFGRYFALVIGNNEYRHLPKLETAVNDARAMAVTLETRYGFEVQLLLDATREGILRALNDYRAELTEKDNLLIYYAGHGFVDRQSNTGFWQPVDAEEKNDLNWIANEDLTRRLNAMSARHVMVIADSCYSGTLVRSSTAALPTGHQRDEWLKRMSEKRSRTAIVSGGIEPVSDAGRAGHSVFAAALLDALNANDSYLEGSTLFQTISRPVVVNADQTPQYSDIRKAGHEGGEFIFAPIIVSPQVTVNVAPSAPVANAPTRAVPDGNAAELAFWRAIERSERAGDYEAYLQQYPEGSFVPLAKSRLAALQEKSDTVEPRNVGGKWLSEAITNPFDKTDVYRIEFEFRVMGERVLGSLIRRSTEDSPRRYPTVKRAIAEGKFDGGAVSFAEPFQVLMGSATEDHKRLFAGELKGDAIGFFVQDTMGNPPLEFSASRVAAQ
jgi:uncharacterized caspase-like protein